MDHVKYHARFYASVGFGLAVWLLSFPLSASFRTAAAGDSFFLIYLLLAWIAGRRLTPDDLRAKAESDDEGITVIVIIALAAIALSLSSLVLVLRQSEGGAAQVAIAFAAVPLGWSTLHTILAFHYAHLYYGKSDKDGSQDAGGLAFPEGAKEPALLDFLYYAFVVGMTAQVSDVQTTGRDMRLATLVHAMVSFFFNTVIVALMVNAAVAGGKGL